MTTSGPTVGDIVLVAVPFSDGQGDKKRPALVMSGQDAHGDLLLLTLTSRPDLPGSVAIAAGDLASGQLDLATWVLPDKLNTIEARRIQRVIGRAAPALMTKVRAVLCPLLGCR